MTTVALVGGTGTLGRLIAERLLGTDGVRLRLLVRPGSAPKAADLVARGAETVEGDLSAGAGTALDALCAGAGAVVSAVQGGPDEIVDGQRRLLAAARRAGVRRLIPSDYSFNIFGLPEGANVNSDWRRAFARAADADRGDVEVVHVLNGCFTDRPVLLGFLGAIDPDRGEAHLWGDGDQPMHFTTYADTAAYTAAAAVDPRPVPRELHVAGDVLDFHGLVGAYRSATGRALTVRRRGTLADLDAHVAELRRSHPGDPYAYLPAMYWRAMLDGTGRLGPLSNDRYPQVHPRTVAEQFAHDLTAAPRA